MKRFLAIALALVLVLSFTVTAFASSGDVEPAEEETADTYSITGTVISAKHNYEVYQIFTGDLAQVDGEWVLSNIKWGENTSNPGELLDDDELTELETFVASLAGKSDAEIAEAFYEKYEPTGEPKGVINKDNDEVGDLPAGYYLIKDEDYTLDDDDAEGEAYTLYIFRVVNDYTLNPKTTNVTSEKKVDDVNDSTGDTMEYQDSADYDIGDSVPYTLTATVAGDVHYYKNYHITFIDQLETGCLKNNKDYTITLGSDELDLEDLPEGLTVDISDDDDDYFEITLTWTPTGDDTYLSEDLDEINVTITFTAELLEDANIGSEGNINTMHLEYSNNPNDEDGVGETPDDTVIVFTYKVVVNKVQPNPDYDPETDDPSKQYVELGGAAFSLYKQYDDEEAVPEGATACEEEGYEDYYLVEAKEADGDTTFEFIGIDDGNYVLVETTTPNGYNSIDPIPFTVTAKHTIEINPYVDDKRTTYLEELNGESTDGAIELVFNQIADDEDALTADVINRSGVILPSTGGIGTTIFYVVGGCLVAAAVVLLITKKRMSQEG